MYRMRKREFFIPLEDNFGHLLGILFYCTKSSSGERNTINEECDCVGGRGNFWIPLSQVKWDSGLRNVDCDGCCWFAWWMVGWGPAESASDWVGNDGWRCSACCHTADCHEAHVWTSNTSSSVLVIVIVCYCASTHGIGAEFKQIFFKYSLIL